MSLFRSVAARVRTLGRQIIGLPSAVVSKVRRRSVRRRILQQKSKIAAASNYTDTPAVTAIVQFFNKRAHARELVACLRASGVDEIIVIDDGSVDGSYRIWPELLCRKNDFLLRCNDIFEIRAYDRAIQMARGEFIILLQDDDLPPPDPHWVNDAILLFQEHPQMDILGGRDGLEILPAEPETASIRYPTVDDPVYSYPGLHSYRIHREPCTTDPKTGLKFEFIDAVNRAPMILRREEFLRNGGMPLAYAPLMCDDMACSLATWRAGRQVGLYVCGFRRNTAGSGVAEFNLEFGQRQAGENWRKLYEDFEDEIVTGTIRSAATELNKRLSTTGQIDAE